LKPNGRTLVFFANGILSISGKKKSESEQGFFSANGTTVYEGLDHSISMRKISEAKNVLINRYGWRILRALQRRPTAASLHEGDAAWLKNERAGRNCAG